MPEHDSTKQEMVNSPPHYRQGKVECIDAIESAVTGLSGMESVCTAHVVKYMWRWRHKNGVEDLRKARYYLDKLIAMQKNTSNSTPDAVTGEDTDNGGR